MPKDTFLNLPAAKRDRFVQAALNEFAGAPYDQASVSRIVAALGIAKGSVYQYFDDKLDLFTWLIEQAGQQRAQRFATERPPAGADLFDALAHAYRTGLRAWVAEPLWNRLLLRLLEPSTEPGVIALRARTQAQVHAFLRALIEDGVASGQLRAGLEVDTTACLVQGVLQDGLLRAFVRALHTDVDGFAARADSLSDADVQAALSVADAAIDLLRRGLGDP